MKYIIEFEDARYVNGSSYKDDILYRAKGFKSLVFDQHGLKKLTPYEEPDRQAIEQEIRTKIEKETYENPSVGKWTAFGRELYNWLGSEKSEMMKCADDLFNFLEANFQNRQAIEQEIREKIENEVWETANMIFFDEVQGGMINKNFKECFPNQSAESVLSNMSYQEVKNIINKWKAEKDDIRVGDEVKTPNHIGVVMKDLGQSLKVFCISKEGDGYITVWNKEYCIKTGRQHTQISDLIEKLSEA